MSDGDPDRHDNFGVGDLVTCPRMYDIGGRPLVCRIVEIWDGAFLLEPIETNLAKRRAVPASLLTLVKRLAGDRDR